MAQITSLTIDGTEHSVSDFGPEVQQLVGVLQQLQDDKQQREEGFQAYLRSAQFEVAKIDALGAAVTQQLSVRVSEALKAKDVTEATEAINEEITKLTLVPNDGTDA